MKIVGYEKRKNKDLFKDFKNLKTLDIKEIQNYIPIYNNFFNFDKTKEINLNHRNFITHIEETDLDENDSESETEDEFPEKIFNIETSNTHNLTKRKSFLKLIPVIEASKFLTGKYKLDNEEFYKLPNIEKNGHPDFYDTNNISYIDSFFSFLSSQILNRYHFVNAIDYYGSFLSLIHNYKLNISDDIEYYIDSDFFMKNKNKLFRIENDEMPTLTFEDTTMEIEFDQLENDTVENISNELIPETVLNTHEVDAIETMSTHSSESSESSCSSRSSHTDTRSDTSETTCSSMIDEINVIFNKYLVQITCLEHCVDTLDTLIMTKSFTTEDQWLSCLFQIIISLVVFQDTFSFTHNDLHTNNIMFIHTKEEFISYCYKGVYYKIPTYGKIFKIIDFGRSIYKVNGQTFCSNSFQSTGDAATQYNCEPYYNPAKTRVEPNFSFDLCRLACSMWDNISHLDKTTGVAKIIDEWCKDDNGLNVLYKRNGDERYPNFKLYKMIARTVHNHTPHNQLLRPEFSKFITSPRKAIMLDDIPVF
jgi:hypothetical protein